ncbi:MAG TPA: hypothetical protein VFJ16_06420 [Longimicrobium sp.]|nr:hypothetical protein [Longimicrobium sp.]
MLRVGAVLALAACNGDGTGSDRPGPPASLTITAGASQTAVAGTPLADSVAVKVVDAKGRAVPGATVQFQVTSGGGSVSPAQVATDTSGTARAAWTLGTTVGAQTLAATVAGANGQPVGSVTFSATATPVPGPGPPASLSITAGANQSAFAGTRLADSVAVKVVDANGRSVPGATVQFQVTSGGGSVSPALVATDTSGTARAAWILGATVGAQTLAATVMGANGQPVASVTFNATANAAPAWRIRLVSGSDQSGPPNQRLADSLVVQVTDSTGAPRAGVPVTWQPIGEIGGGVSPNPAISRADGTAKGAWTLGPVLGRVSLRASVPGGANVVFFADAVSDLFTINVTTPLPGRRVAVDTLRVNATASVASGTLVRVTARVGTASTDVTSGTGVVNLAGLPEGQLNLLVTAVSSTGDSATRFVPFTLARPPQLQVTAPPPYTGLRAPQVNISASCTDPSGCRLEIGNYATTVILDTKTFEGTVQLLDALEPNRVVVTARDPLNAATADTILVYVETSPALAELGSAGTHMWDADASRVLYLDSVKGAPSTLKVRALAGGAETVLFTFPAGAVPPDANFGRLYPGGAVFLANGHVWDWRGAGSPVDLGTGGLLEVAGSWAVWTNGSTAFRRDLAAGSTQTLGAVLNAFGYRVDVATNGDAAWVGADGNVRWLHGGGTILVTSDAPAPGSPPFLYGPPGTDGTRVVFGQRDLSTQGYRLVQYSGGTVTPVDAYTDYLATAPNGTPRPHYEFEVENGWIAYLMYDNAGKYRLFTLAPDGTKRQVTSSATERIDALGPAGQVVFVRAARRYVAVPPYTAEPTGIGWAHGRVEFEGTQLNEYLGRTAFKVNF